MKINKKKYELAMARACMGQKELVKAGIPRGTLIGILQGRDARPETIGKVAKALGVDVTEILED